MHNRFRAQISLPVLFPLPFPPSFLPSFKQTLIGLNSESGTGDKMKSKIGMVLALT